MLAIPENHKKLFRGTYVPRDIHIHFPNGEMRDLTKKDIYDDGSSFSFTESLCSQSNLKFGLSEKSVIKFDAIDVKNMKGCTIEVSCEIIDPETGEPVSIPYGRFIVDSCKKQSDMRRRKVIAYSGATLEVSPLTRAKLALPSLNAWAYRLDIDELIGTGDRQRERFMHPGDFGQTEFTMHTQGMDFDIISLSAAYTDSDGYPYVIYCDLEYAYKTVTMVAAVEQFETIGVYKWYDIRSEIEDVSKVVAWDKGVRDIEAYLDRLKAITVYQEGDKGTYLDDFLLRCDTYLTNYTVRMDVLQTYAKKKLHSRKDVPITMDDMGGGVKRSRYVSSALLDVSNGRAHVSDNIVIMQDTPADGTLTFMCPKSIDVRVERRLEDQPSETVFSRSVISGRKDMLVGYGEMNKLHVMGRGQQSEGEQPRPVSLPYIQFERNEGDDGYFWCADVEKNLPNAASAIAEIQAKFVHLDRYGVTRLVGISDNFGLYPDETLYPSDDLYPNENNGGLLDTCEYMDIWNEDYEVQPYGTVIVNYKNESGNDEVLVYRFNRANKNVYHIKDNFIFKTGGWKPADIRNILNTWFVPGVAGIQYIPAELEMIGLPYIEAGDVLSVQTRTDKIAVFVFRRTLQGINHMTDSIEARGDELNEVGLDDSVTLIEKK